MITSTDQEHMRSNQRGWNMRVVAHLNSTYYNLAEFRAGKSSLRRLEKETVGDVRGRSFLHLQCHVGLNAISWAKLGAEVTAVDFAEEALAIGRGLAEDVGAAIRFVYSNIFDLPKNLDGDFDIVYTDYGVLGWLPDLGEWARVIAHFLKPGGVFHLVEIHPAAAAFTDADGDLELTPLLFNDGPYGYEVTSTYGDEYGDNRQIPSYTEYFWPYTTSRVITALMDAGLRLEVFRETPVDCRQRFQTMVPDPHEEGCWRLPGDPIPLTFAVSARRPA